MIADGPRVLLVDDEAAFRAQLRRILTDYGVDVVGEAGSGQQALELADLLRPDVVLMDLRMPGMDGLTTIRAIRARRDDKWDVPIVVLTADTGPDIRAECLVAGADEMIMKPVHMNALFDTIVAVTTKRNGLSGLVA
jgi:CheY-like chemotaxis protein